MPLTEARRRRRIVGGAVAVTFVLIECLRIWMPSIHATIGDDGSAAVALVVVVLATLGVAPVLGTQIGRIGARPTWIVGGMLLVVGRGALIITDGGAPQGLAATVGVIGGCLGLMALASSSPAPHQTRIGVLVGLSAATVVHAVTRTAGLIWPETTFATVASLVVLVVLSEMIRRSGAALRGPTDEPTPTAAWPWLTLLPLFLLVGQISGVPGRLTAVTGWPSPTIAMAIAATQMAAILAALVAPRLGSVTAGWSGGSLVLIGTVASIPVSGWLGVVGPAILVTGLGLIIGVDAANVRGRTTGRRHAQVAAWSILGFGVLTTLYYASYSSPVGLNNRWLPLGAALLAAGIGLAVARTGGMATTRVPFSLIAATRTTAAAAVVIMLAGLLTDGTARSPVDHIDDGRVRVALLNIRSGFDTRTRFAPEAQAEVLRATATDVVVLNEVNRGWLSMGGHDALTLLAAELGLPHVTFARAADELWGQAVLSRFPIVERTATRLPRGADTMSRSELTVVLDLGHDQQFGVIATQLSPNDAQGDTRLPQARAVAASAARLRERQIPMVVMGDLEAEPGSPELATFAPLVGDVVPANTPTYPAPAPSVQHDHVLASPDLRRVRVQALNVDVSDHLPLIVDLELL